MRLPQHVPDEHPRRAEAENHRPLENFIRGVFTANSIDDMTTDASGQTVAQRAAGDNSTAKGFVNLTKAVSSFVSAGSSTMTLIDKGIEKAGVYAIDMANGTYNGIKSTITAVKDFLSGNDDKDKNTKKH